MQTYSHFLITAALRKPLNRFVADKKIPPVRPSALLLGSVMPDLLLIVISIVCIVIDLVSGLSFGAEAFREQSVTAKLFDDWFF